MVTLRLDEPGGDVYVCHALKEVCVGGADTYERGELRQ